MYKILIGVPHIGNIRAELTEWLLCMKSNQEFDVTFFLPWGRPITANRNNIVKKFIETDCDYLLQIDSDIQPPMNLLEMVRNEKDVCSAFIQTAKGSEIIPLGLMKQEDGSYAPPKEYKVGINEVDAVGAGCLLLSRKVVEDIGRFEGDREDFEFCEVAKSKGYDIYFDARYRCKHFQIIGF